MINGTEVAPVGSYNRSGSGLRFRRQVREEGVLPLVMEQPDNHIPYDREVLLTVITYHYRKDPGSCGCGWSELGMSHPAHIADVYEQSVQGLPTTKK